MSEQKRITANDYKESNFTFQLNRDDVYNIISFITKFDTYLFEFDIINKREFDPDKHNEATMHIIRKCFQHHEKLMSMLTDDAMVVYIIIEKDVNKILEELNDTIKRSIQETRQEEINDGFCEYIGILRLLQRVLKQDPQKE